MTPRGAGLFFGALAAMPLFLSFSAAAGDSPQYKTHCMLCHGVDARGIEGLGVNLVDSAWVAERSVQELVAFLKRGRLPNDPDSVSARPMPGFAWVDDGDLAAIATHVKSLNQP